MSVDEAQSHVEATMIVDKDIYDDMKYDFRCYILCAKMLVWSV